MATIDHDAKTVSTVCQPDDEAGVRVALQEILDDNPGYTPVLVVEGADGKETTYTSLTSTDVAKRPRGRPRTRTVMVEVEEPIPDDELTDEEVAEDEAVEDSSEE